jgi:hypothetical protein
MLKDIEDYVVNSRASVNGSARSEYLSLHNSIRRMKAKKQNEFEDMPDYHNHQTDQSREIDEYDIQGTKQDT